MKKLFLLSLLTLSSGALWAMDENQLQEIENQQTEQKKPSMLLNVLKINQKAHEGLDVLGQHRALNIPTITGNLTPRQKEQQFVGAFCAFLENVTAISPIPAQEGAALLSFDSVQLTNLRKRLRQMCESTESRKQLRQMSKASEESTENKPTSLNKYNGFGNSPLLKYTMTFVGGFSAYWLLQKLGVLPF
jgi:hypothetical protein